MQLPTVYLLIVLLGHMGLHIAFYNRINATGLKRPVLKTIERLVGLECFLAPIAFVYWDMFDRPWPMWLSVYATLCIVAVIILGTQWLVYRPIFGVNALATPRQVRTVDVVEEVDTPIIGSQRLMTLASIPMNQVTQMAFESKSLPVAGLPAALDGLRIAHLSDIHLTGDMLPAFYRYASEQVAAWNPDMVCVTGDIVDQNRCIEWLPDCFAPLIGRDDCYFILGNHDLRVSQPDRLRQELAQLGWVDVGGNAIARCVKGETIVIAGNQMPWFEPLPSFDEFDSEWFRVLLSHSPDQIQWARRMNVGLMLAGHTHGGQGRLPLIGPVLSPSWYGSRFASGEFYLPPTTLHVTRGLFGTHMMRINCPPEVSLLTLSARPQPSGV